MTMIKDHLGQTESPDVPLNIDGMAYTIDWPSVQPLGPLKIERLPSLDYALYLINTVKFRLGQMYHLFDETIFMQGIYAFYAQDPLTEPPSESRVWYMQYLLIMALGQALLSGFVTGRKPPGSELVGRAIELLPDTFGLYRDPILSIEVLCCLALFLHSIDHRNGGYTYVRAETHVGETVHNSLTCSRSGRPCELR